MTRDIFRPRHEPARTIYDAFQAEAAKRHERPTFSDWAQREREAVWRAARDYAQQHGLAVPTMDQVRDSEQYALGHVDYGAKWAYGVARAMEQQEAKP